MPTTRHRRSRNPSGLTLTKTHERWLRDNQFDPTSDDILIWSGLDDQGVSPPDFKPRPWLMSGIVGADLWRMLADEIVAEHVRESPGSRPLRWWQFTAPEARQRLGGIGEHGDDPLLMGVPADWIMASIDRVFPPLYESEPSFLRRLGLLTRSEEKLLTPEDLEPVAITDIIELDLG